MKKIQAKQAKPRPQTSLCVIFRDNLGTLPALLESVKGHFDEYVFTDTGSTDGSRGLIESFLKTSAGKVTNFAWIDDFAAARNACFNAATGRWRMFLDSDDRFENGSHLRTWISRIEKEQPQIRGVFVPYNYDKDEGLFTMRLVRWDADGQWAFADAIHERLVWTSTPGLSEGEYARTRDFGVLHKRKTAAEKIGAIKRNAIIAAREYPTATDREYKARLARTLAMAMKADGEAVQAIPYLQEVHAVYGHIPEGRQAAADLSRIFSALDNKAEALRYGELAGPSYAAIVHHLSGDHAMALEKHTKGANMEQQTTHEGFLTEKAIAPVACAESALDLSYAPERIEHILNAVRSDLRHHPALIRSVDRIRKAIDRITIVVPGTPQPFDHESGKSMLGGSEESVVYLVKALASLGRNVRVYTPLPFHRRSGLDPNGVDWQDIKHFNPHDEHGCLVIWRSAHFVMYLANLIGQIQEARKAGDEKAVPLTGIRAASLWLHDRGLGVPPADAFGVCQAVDSVVCLSEHHKRQIIIACGGNDPGNIHVLSNGIVASQYDHFLGNLDADRDQNSVVYSSCPSRGLRPLLDMWPKVKEEVPTAKLDIYYDWSMLANADPALYKDIMERYESVRHLDVVHHGGVGHAQLNDALRRCNVWAYSHFENTDVETFCISAVKATACGATVLTSGYGALPEVAPDSIQCLSPAPYRRTLIEKLKFPDTTESRVRAARRALERFDWNAVAVRFSDLWHGISPPGLNVVTPKP